MKRFLLWSLMAAAIAGLALTPGIDYTATWLGERAEGDGLYDVRVALAASAAIAPAATPTAILCRNNR